MGEEARLPLLSLHLPVLVEAGGVGAARRRDERPAVQVQQVLQRRVDLEHHTAAAAAALRQCKVAVGGPSELGALSGLGQVEGGAVAALATAYRERHLVEEEVLLPGHVFRRCLGAAGSGS